MSEIMVGLTLEPIGYFVLFMATIGYSPVAYSLGLIDLIPSLI